MTRKEQYRRASRDLIGQLNVYPTNDIYEMEEYAPMLHDKIRDYFQFFNPGEGFENTFLGFINLLADTTKAVSVYNSYYFYF